jgi:iron complex transport system ATP-binding protein
MDVEAVVALGRMPHRGRFGGQSDADRAAIQNAMQNADIERFAKRRVLSLSGGERARVLLARALAGTPDWLLADEPLAHLDPAHQLDMLKLLGETAAQGCGVVMVIHDLALAARTADKILLLHEGKVFAQGTPAKTLTSQNIADVYGVHADVQMERDGKLDVRITTRA